MLMSSASRASQPLTAGISGCRYQPVPENTSTFPIFLGERSGLASLWAETVLKRKALASKAKTISVRGIILAGFLINIVQILVTGRTAFT